MKFVNEIFRSYLVQFQKLLFLTHVSASSPHPALTILSVFQNPSRNLRALAGVDPSPLCGTSRCLRLEWQRVSSEEFVKLLSA